MDTTIAAVFSSAGQATAWTRTNLGTHTEISYGGYLWTVELPPSGEGVARIGGRYGYGGCEHLQIAATPAQTISIVEAALAALRAPITTAWKALSCTDDIGEYATREAAQKQVEDLIRAERTSSDRVLVSWDCPSCYEEECEDCLLVGAPRVLVASWAFAGGWMSESTWYSVEAA